MLQKKIGGQRGKKIGQRKTIKRTRCSQKMWPKKFDKKEGNKKWEKYIKKAIKKKRLQTQYFYEKTTIKNAKKRQKRKNKTTKKMRLNERGKTRP